MSQPWKSDKWYVSPWNYLKEVTEAFAFAPQIKIHDMTLRDGEQQAGLELRRDDKIRLVEALAEAGVHRIEAGMPAVSQQDEDAIREIVKRNLGPEIFAFCRCVVDDVKGEIFGRISPVERYHKIFESALPVGQSKSSQLGIDFDCL